MESVADNPLTNLIRRRFNDLDYNHQRLAKRVGVSRPAVYAWLRGGNVSDAHRRKLAQALRVDPVDLMNAAADRGELLARKEAKTAAA
ncbi:MAG: helix-turn-helix transcriptional regulator [Myxococcota bacterium]